MNRFDDAYIKKFQVIRRICNRCGRSVGPGSGLFVDRVPDFNDYETRKANGCKFPEGDYVCRECDNDEYRRTEK